MPHYGDAFSKSCWKTTPGNSQARFLMILMMFDYFLWFVNEFQRSCLDFESLDYGAGDGSEGLGDSGCIGLLVHTVIPPTCGKNHKGAGLPCDGCCCYMLVELRCPPTVLYSVQQDWDNYSNLISLPDFLEFSFGGGFSGQEWFQWVRDQSFHRRRVN